MSPDLQPSADASRRDPQAVRQIRQRQAALAVLFMSVGVVVTTLAMWLGDQLDTASLWWGGASLGGLVVAYVVIARGYSLRFADPSLTAAQMTFAAACCAVGYAMAGPARAVVLPMLAVVMMFGMFELRARTAIWISIGALLLMGAAMLWRSLTHPTVYPPRIELAHFLMLAAVLAAICVLASRMSDIRRRLRAQKASLLEALGRIETLATRDALTGLVNRRHMQALLDQELARSQRSGQVFCLALIDLDHFKRVNDQHGHAAGDALLQAFALAGAAGVRAADVLARWGGEEFVLLLPDTGMPAAREGLARLRERIAALSVDHEGTALRLTLSAGLSEYLPGEKITQTLERADRLLYDAKRGGRNRVAAQ